MKTIRLSFLLVFISITSLYAQKERIKNSLGLTIEYGIGSTAIVDEYISQERYTGSMPIIGFWYGRVHEKSAYQVGIIFQQGDKYENYATNADFTRVSLNYDLFYSVKEFSLFHKPVTFLLGPSVEYFEYEFNSNFVGNYSSFSELIMASLGMNFALDYIISERFSTNLFLRTNILGVSAKTHDSRRYEDMDTKFLGLFSANNINGDLSAKYKLLKFLSAGLKFKGQYTRSISWDHSKTFTNSVLLFITFHI